MMCRMELHLRRAPYAAVAAVPDFVPLRYLRALVTQKGLGPDNRRNNPTAYPTSRFACCQMASISASEASAGERCCAASVRSM